MLEDIATFFDVGEEDDNEVEFKTSQQSIRIKQLFREYIVRDWKQADFNCTKHTDLNKIIV